MTEPRTVTPERPGALRSLARAMTSWRTASVSLLGFSSGLPLGIVWIAIPDWMRKSGMDIRVVGLITLAQIPFTFKFLWSPLMDRFSLPWMGRRRGWIALAQVALFLFTLGLAGLGNHPDTPWILGALAFAISLAGATQDIAYDAYTVDVLKPEEQGIAVGARNAFYWIAFRGLGSLSIAAAAMYSWPLVNVFLALTFIPMIFITWRAPEPADVASPPRTMREAVWQPFIGFLGRHRALEILAFVFFYKLADNLAVALIRPFLIDKGYGDFDRSVALASIGVAASIAGTMIGGSLTNVLGLGRSLWLFGFLQIFSNIGYVFVARSEVDRVLMYSAAGFDNFATGLGSGAFLVLLLRLTQKRFSATQYAIFSSLFRVSGILAGPITGFLVDAIGWEAFFWSTLLAGLPGLALLQRFAPLGEREPRLELEPPPMRPLPPLGPGGLIGRGVAGGLVALCLGAGALASLAALKSMRTDPGAGFDPMSGLVSLMSPADMGEWMQTVGVLVFGLFAGMATAAVFAARHGTQTSGQ
ncbi:MAG TPA: MFS transporter [Patescibacteria group bacterium]|nr:MFS transporter [Patescibacteria group bacterium]